MGGQPGGANEEEGDAARLVKSKTTSETTGGAPPSAADERQLRDSTTTTTTTTATASSAAVDQAEAAKKDEENGENSSDKQLLDAECERLLRNTKRQVKQMMEEAVTKKFIHEDSSSIISLCVSIDACLSHQLKRRALGLFKTNSSTALVRKIAKLCPEAETTISMVEEEERRQQEEAKCQKRRSASSTAALQPNQDGRTSSAMGSPLGTTPRSPIKQVASNSSVHKRNMWIKCALIEKKLVAIVEHLAANANKYYEPEALMANPVSAQLLCSLLVGPCALEFSKSKTNDFHLYEEPSADELLKRHHLSNPIECLCSAHSSTASHRSRGSGGGGSMTYSRSIAQQQQQQQQQQHDDRHHVLRSLSTSTGGHKMNKQRQSATVDGGDSPSRPSRRRRVSTMSESSLNDDILEEENHLHNKHQHSKSHHSPPSSGSLMRKSSAGQTGGSSRRRPLALRTNIKTGALVTECHHSACQEISEHQQTRGYSFTSATSNSQQGQTLGGSRTPSSSPAGRRQEGAPAAGNTGDQRDGSSCTPNATGNASQANGGGLQEVNWPAWSPRMLHETLHQNSKSSLLYAKNNVLLETHSHGTVAGYLSLHQTSSSDLILKWIPNQLINGGHSQPQDSICNCHHQSGCATTREAIAKRQAHSTSGALCDSPQRTSSIKSNNSVMGQSPGAADTGTRSTPIQEQGTRSHSVSTSECSTDCSYRSQPGQNGCACNQDANTEEHQQAEQQQQDPASSASSSRAIGGSYLDLVISLSVSRIVLLHCHFNGMLTSEFFNSDNERFAPCQETDNTDNARPNSDLEETLVLVEADGVQRAPFRFPKGGLRWFLSCLENGLGPDRCLEPAIRAGEDEGHEGDLETAAASGTPPCDPLRVLHSNAGWTAQHNGCMPSRLATTSGSDSPSTASEPATGVATNGNSRLEVLLRRLPSLRRGVAQNAANAPSSAHNKSGSAELTSVMSHSTGSGPNSRLESPTLGQRGEPTARGQLVKRPRPIDYVYRIVAMHQLDWPQQTPPLSALSIDSSSSSSFLTLGINGVLHQHNKRHHQPMSNYSPRAVQRFSWSLSKLARFSSRNNSTSSSSAGNGQAQNSQLDNTTTNNSKSTLGSLTSLLYLNYNKATLDSVGSLDSNQQSTDSNNVPPLAAMRRDSSSKLIRIEAKLNDLKKSSTEELMALRDQSVQTLCESMRKQILARAFYGWLVYCRRMKIVRNHLMDLINDSRLETLKRRRDAGKKTINAPIADEDITRDQNEDDASQCEFNKDEEEARKAGLTWSKWRELQQPVQGARARALLPRERRKLALTVNRLVYYGGIEDDKLRAEVWPYLFGHYKFGDSCETRRKRDDACRAAFESSARDWVKIERVIKERDSAILAANMAKVAKRRQREQMAATNGEQANGFSSMTSETTDQDSPVDMLREDNDEAAGSQIDETQERACAEGEADDDRDNCAIEEQQVEPTENNENNWADNAETHDKTETDDKNGAEIKTGQRAGAGKASSITSMAAAKARAKRQRRMRRRFRLESTGSVGSDASITDQFGNNIHRIDKDVLRCDRQFWYFQKTDNLNKLRRIMCGYVWKHLDVGYVQGMCDLAAPLLVIFDQDELMAFNCFDQLMKRMVANFPHGSAMDQHFEHLKYLMQVLDPKLFEILQNNGDYTHYYFCYRWLLLDFKRELAYEDVYRVWEAIWAARWVTTDHFVVFLALAMIRFYRDIIIENNMDFTDTIKFFNEMAERHDAEKIIALAQDCVLELEGLIGI